MPKSAMTADSGVPLQALKVDGGASRNNLLMQHQADVLGIPVLRGQTIETTALGAAYLAGLATGVWGAQEELRSVWKLDREFVPNWSTDKRKVERNSWRSAVSRCLSPRNLL